ncbi:MAG: hypothetical protein GX804_06895, partial [Lentisphaerae bacterium]|nr:hypothetical protein [Lentisphaerota bacterium]
MKNKIENLLRTRIIMFSRNAGTERRSGSALLVVLGILAVLMMMSVFFSVFMRTERAGTTNLRHSIVAKQSMQTALASVMASIDRSFENPTNDWPIPAWPEGFLASSETAPYYQSRILLDEGQSSANNQTFWNKRSGNAHVLTEEIRKHLSPSQIALVNNAVIGWAPIKGGVVASAAEGQAGGDRSFVRPEDDQVVGRYAFVALNTT